MDPEYSRAVIEQDLVSRERNLVRAFRWYRPEEVSFEAATRLRGEPSKHKAASTAPFAMVRAIEASCAYFQPQCYQPLERGDFDMLCETVFDIDDSMAVALLQGGGLMSFLAHTYRTQMKLQHTLWLPSVGRTQLMFGDTSKTTELDAAFVRRYSLSIQQWLQMAFLVYASLSNKEKPLVLTPQHLAQLDQSGFSQSAGYAFLQETSLSPVELGSIYRTRRFGPQALPAWEWYQRPSLLSERPILRFGKAYGLPVPSLIVGLFENQLFGRLGRVATGYAREELSNVFDFYIQNLLQHQLGVQVIPSKRLRHTNNDTVCDCAFELSDAIVLIEAKSIVFDRNTMSEKSLVVDSTEIAEGMAQVAITADRIRANALPNTRFNSNKPIVGFVVTLDYFPHANNDVLFDKLFSIFGKYGLSGERLSSGLSERPMVLNIEALEGMTMWLKRNDNRVMPLIAEKRSSNLHSVGDWPLFLMDKIDGGRGHDLSLWKDALDRLI